VKLTSEIAAFFPNLNELPPSHYQWRFKSRRAHEIKHASIISCDSEPMITAIPPNDRHHDPDMSVEILLLAAVGITTPIIMQTHNPDMYAIPGAILAAVVALLKAISEKRDWSQKSIVVVGTTVIGSTGPATAMHWWFPDAISKLIPQAHALLGFLSGLLGWLFFWAGYLILDRRKDSMMKAAIKEAEKRIIGGSRIEDDEPHN
jgi:hypothetical protein